jgi:hypothetical protein
MMGTRPAAGVLDLNPFPSDGLAAGRPLIPGRKPQVMNDFTEMDDPEFLVERRRLHDAIADASPADVPDAELRNQYAAIEAEFLRRAGLSFRSVA